MTVNDLLDVLYFHMSSGIAKGTTHVIMIVAPNGVFTWTPKNDDLAIVWETAINDIRARFGNHIVTCLAKTEFATDIYVKRP